ncbi:DUF5008 domain-containing protein [Sphingobacterium sp. HJSM2_6]|uniref:DUF5008 domain-containing protein n=1 Tax=Sphingobacterium sp. HJSM2_6 TaxID=3366264 RepID=UPI003BD2E58E
MKINLFNILGLAFILALSSCNKEIEFHSNPYEEGKQAIGIVMERTQLPSPSVGTPGTEVKIKATGLLAFREKLKFFFNGQIAEIISVTDQDLTVKVPEFASSGITFINVDDIVVYGPEFDVVGKIQIDPSWQALIGTNNGINNLFETPDDKIIYVGSFTNYENRGLVKPINRLVRTYKNGNYDVSWRTGTGANGSLNSLVQIGNHYYIGGAFSGYDQRRDNISNLTRIHVAGQIDTMPVIPFRRPDQTDTIKYYPTFNGGFEGSVNKIYNHENKILAVGNFRYHINRIYGKPNFMETRDSVILDSTEIRNVARLNLDGTLDKTYRFNNNTALPGANGNVNSYFHEEGTLKGKLLVYGNFNRFDNTPVGYITRLNANGTIDQSFNVGGEGANYRISNVSYNETTGKYILVGDFRSFNGVNTPKMVMLNSDGSIDDSFKVQVFDTGSPSFAQQLDDGLIVVSGQFNNYGGIIRKRFMILDSSGQLASGLNTTGMLNGSLSKVVETQSDDGRRALLLIGYFSKFDEYNPQNIIRLIIE